MMRPPDPAPPLACADVRRDTAFGRARGITAGHSVACASFGLSVTCPRRQLAPGEAPRAEPPRTPIAAMLLALNEALARTEARR